MKRCIAGNWKLHHTTAEARAFAQELRPRLEAVASIDVWLYPPATLLAPLVEALEGTGVRVGAQNLHYERKGAFTGELGVDQILDTGAQGVLVGHSERRHVFGESDETVGRKAAAALDGGLHAVLCVGETLEQREADRTRPVVSAQLAAGLDGVPPDALDRLSVAYEPVWAIGTGRTATPEQAQEVHAFLRGLLVERFGPDRGRGLRLLYGGSVKPDNVAGLVARDDVDGCLVGGASLSADSFSRLLLGAQ